MKYFYEVGASGREGPSHRWRLAHDQKLTKDEFRAMFANAMVESCVDTVKAYEEWGKGFYNPIEEMFMQYFMEPMWASDSLAKALAAQGFTPVETEGTAWFDEYDKPLGERRPIRRRGSKEPWEDEAMDRMAEKIKAYLNSKEESDGQ